MALTDFEWSLPVECYNLQGKGGYLYARCAVGSSNWSLTRHLPGGGCGGCYGVFRRLSTATYLSSVTGHLVDLKERLYRVMNFALVLHATM